MLKAASKAVASSATWPPALPSASEMTTALLGIGSYLHDAALGAGYRAPDEQEVLLGNDIDDGEAALRDPGAAHVTGAAQALRLREGVAEAPIEPGARTL